MLEYLQNYLSALFMYPWSMASGGLLGCWPAKVGICLSLVLFVFLCPFLVFRFYCPRRGITLSAEEKIEIYLTFGSGFILGGYQILYALGRI